MSLRDALQNSPAVSVVVAAVLIGLSALVFMRSRGSVLEGYYFDVKTGELFTAPRDLSSPIDAPSGADNGMRAYVFACGECAEGSMEIAYIEHLSEAARQMQASYTPDPAREAEYQRVMEAGHRVATPPVPGEEPKWVGFALPEGQGIINAHRTMCNGGSAQACMP